MPEEVCANDPALLFEVREGLEQFRRVEAQIDAVFPSTGPSKRTETRLRPPSTLPVIPGYEIQACWVTAAWAWCTRRGT
jgi:hypothetical protein